MMQQNYRPSLTRVVDKNRQIHYNISFLKNLQFRSNQQNINWNINLMLKELKILRSSRKFRGCRGGRKRIKYKNIANQIYNIEVIKTSQRYATNIKQQQTYQLNKRKGKNSKTNYLKKIECLSNNFVYPRILYANIRSAAKNFDSLQVMHQIYVPNIIILTETWITETGINCYELENFNVAHRIRNRKDKHHGGGVSIYLEKGFTVHEVKMPDNDNIEAITIKFRSSLLPRDIPHFVVIAIYCPPQDEHKQSIIDYIGSEIDNVLSRNPLANVFIIGDFNDIDPGFLKQMQTFSQIIDQPTHGNARLDLCFTNTKIKYNVDVVQPMGSSDHAAVTFVPSQNKKPCRQSYNITIRSKRKSNFLSMGKTLLEHDWSDWYGIVDIQCAAQLFHDFISGLYKICFPLIEKKINPSNAKWIGPEIIKLIKLKNIAFKDNNVPHINELGKKVKIEIRKAKKKWFNSLIKDARKGSLKYFDVIKKVSNIEKNKSPVMFPDKSIETTYDEIFKFFKSLANIHKPLSYSSINTIENDLIPLQVDQLKIFNLLSKLRKTSSTAPDGIPQFILADFALELTEPITHLINLSLSQGICPEVWKKSFLRPLPKNKNPKNVENIRPISISPCLSKICERIVFEELVLSLLTKIDRFQFGGLPGKSTMDYLLSYLNQVIIALEQPNTSVVSIVTDYAKAYDNIDHNVFFLFFFTYEPTNSAY